jgi:glycosyltransferase involved in cell wall biosynthesis
MEREKFQIDVEDNSDLVFSQEQIEYLKKEFDRQRNWINVLSVREKLIQKELRNIQNSFSYKFGRFVTWLPRRIVHLFKPKHQINNNEIEVKNIEEWKKKLLPSSLLISPELLQSGDTSRHIELLIDNILLLTIQNHVSVDTIRDEFIKNSQGIDTESVLEVANLIMDYLLSNELKQSITNNVFVGIMRALSKTSNANALNFAEKFVDIFDDKRAVKTLIQIHIKIGNYVRPLELLKRLPNDDWNREQRKKLEPVVALIHEGFDMLPESVAPVEPKVGNIYYHASQSQPHTTSGYAIRTHGLVSSLLQKGYNIQTFLRHGYPTDRSDFDKDRVPDLEEIDGVSYIFSTEEVNSPNFIDYNDVFNFEKFIEYEQIATNTIIKNAQSFCPMVIHSASNFVVGLAGAKAAKQLGIPSIYEIRGLWQLTQSTKRDGYEFSDHFLLSEKLEIEAAKHSDYVFTITNSLKNFLIERGVDAGKIEVLPNAVELEKFEKVERDVDLEKELDLSGKVVIGYVGSFVEYEGIDLLIHAVHLLKEKYPNQFRLLLVGGGDLDKQLRELVKTLDLTQDVIFTGRVPHSEVSRYYSLIDIAPIPRKSYPVCELVVPLKPFEAMVLGKVLIVSNVEALEEIIDDGHTGFIFEKENFEDLADKIELVLNNPKLRMEIGIKAENWVKENHIWASISERVSKVYEKIKE